MTYDGKRTMGAILAQRAAELPDHEIVRFEDDSLTYGQLDDRASRVAAAFAGFGLAQGDTVAVQLPNCAEFVCLWFGLARAGIVEVPLNVGLRGDLLAYALNRAECRAIVISPEWLPNLAKIAPRLTHVQRVIVVEEAPPSGREPDAPAPPPIAESLAALPWASGTYAELVATEPDPPDVEVEPWDPAIVIFTSGTTGPSKGVVLSHTYGFETARTMVRVNEYEPDEVIFTAFPLFHTNARYASILVAMLLGTGRVVMHRRFSASRFWDICREHDVTAFNFMGALLLMLFKQAERPDDADNPARKGWGAPAPVDIAERFERRFGVTLTEGYGMTETGIATSNTVTERKFGSCGKPVPEYDVEIHDEHGFPVPDDTVGEIVLRPLIPNVLFEEYYDMPESTLASFRGLWFHTGDRGRRDADGWFYFVDRAKDAIRRRGENISSWEVEQVLNDHPDIQESAVVGVPSELSEEEVLAAIRLEDGAELAPERVIEFAEERLPRFAVPRYLRFVDELPKNQQQRIQKFILREEGVTPDCWERS